MNETPNSQELLLKWMEVVSDYLDHDCSTRPFKKIFYAYKNSLSQPASDSVPSATTERKAREWWVEVRADGCWNIFYSPQAMDGERRTREMIHIREVLPSENEQSK